MFKNLFGKLGTSSKTEKIMAPMSGKVVDLTEVPDPVFSQKLMGEGVAIIPSDGIVTSPVNGEIVQIFNTKHAIALRSNSGIEIIIHIGLETVNLKGEGFEIYAKEGQRVKVGDKILKVDLNLIDEKGYNPITPVVIVNGGEKAEKINKNLNIESVLGNTTIMEIEMKKN